MQSISLDNDLFADLEEQEEQKEIQEKNNHLPPPPIADLEDELFSDDDEANEEHQQEGKENEKKIQLAALELLNNSNLNEISLRQIREQLAEKYHIDTETHKKLIRTIVESYVSEHQTPGEEEEEEEEEDLISEVGNGKEKEKDPLGERNTELNGKKKRTSVFSKPASLSPALATFMGRNYAPRGEVVKAIWDYIKANNLQNPKDRRVVIFDEKLFPIFKKKSSHFMKMSGLLAKEMKSVDQLAPSSVKEEEEDEDDEGSGQEEEENDDAEENNTKSKKRSHSSTVYRKGKPVTAPTKKQKTETTKTKSTKKPVSAAKTVKNDDSSDNGEDDDDDDDEEEEREESKKVNAKKKTKAGTKLVRPDFATFLKIDEATPRKHVVKELYAYIKENNLQNPKDKREILLDEALQQFFKVKKVTYFSINKHLNKVFYET